MYLENDLELERCDEELRRNDERRKKILERKNRRIRQIREKQLKDKDAWVKKLIPLLDKALEDRLGSLYWYRCSAEDICVCVTQMEIPAGLAKEADVSETEKVEEDKGRRHEQRKPEADAENDPLVEDTEE